MSSTKDYLTLKKPYDADKELRKNIDKFTNMVGKNGLCIPIAISYKVAVQIVNALVGPVAIMKEAIVTAMDNSKVVKALDKIINVVDKLNAGIPNLPTLSVSRATLLELDIFSKICLDFDDILPNAIKGLINDVADSINEGLEELTDYALPEEFSDALDSIMETLEVDAVNELLDDIEKTILTPLTVYRDYIESTGIVAMLKRLQKFEKCMTNPNTCDRPREEFYFPGTKIFNSQYYINFLGINLKGEILVGKLKESLKSTNGNVNKTLKSIKNYTPVTGER